MPLDLGPLMGTLSGMNAQTFADAIAQQMQEEAARRTAEAAQASQAAGQEYQQAAGDQAPDVDPLAQSLGLSLGNIASVIGQDPEFRKRAQENIKTQRAQLLQTRADNLKALQDVFSQKAKAAQDAGDLEAQTEARIKLEQLSKTHERILETQKQAGRVELAGIEGKTARDVAEIRERESAGAAAKAISTEQRRVSGATASIAAGVRADPDIKNFVTIRDQFNMGLRSSQAKSNLGDILLMRAIARASDPLSSVREEEFRTFKGAQGVLAQQGINLTRAMWGRGMLSDFGRRQMVGELRKIYNAKKIQYNRAYEQYRTRAIAEGVPEENVLRDYTTPDQVEEATTPVDGVSGGKIMVVNPKGKRFEIDASDLPEAIARGWKRTQ